jgi:hypothetical protein
MALGPGKYDNLCSLVRRKAMARCALVIVLNGNKGDGFSCQMQTESPLEYTRTLIVVLRSVLEQLEADLIALLDPANEAKARDETQREPGGDGDVS